MADQGDNNNFIIRYVYRGEEGEIIPRGATHIFMGEGVTFVRARAFQDHPNIVEVICHDRVERIGEHAFCGCQSLRRVIMPGVKVVEEWAFQVCIALTDVECGMLEIIKDGAFWDCISLSCINLSSVRIVEINVFSYTALTDVKFSSKLERIGGVAFGGCTSLERITIPLKDGLIGNDDDDDDIFIECNNLRHVDLVEGALHETISALQLGEWRNDMNEEIDSINQILLNAHAGEYDFNGYNDYAGEKALVIRTWIRSVLGKIVRYQEAHNRLLNEAAATLQLPLPQDIVTNSVFPFLELPSYTFEVEEDGVEDDDSDMYANGSYSEGEDSGMEVDNSDDEEE